ncbi:magnesium-translocating P-type ATPase [Oleiagrimonas sp. C23AA]|uniref:magnesium-translocating P-type ATPase n=1 Tax=Oleiagrimonas sp. C23AA TaxID=2719047 RepID=UPI0014206A6C|nr:magnesium-translocating P-type ATPase [Oleiagrimonas sp. C23AA]NII11077.1 magnesium-translocating P-type ATPase [Oleiagrimonas sp. C23AA]
MRGDNRYWARSASDVLASLDSRMEGLSSGEVAERLRRVGPNTLAGAATLPWLRLLVSRFTSPLVLILIVAAVVSLLVRDWVGAWIVLAIILLTAVLSFFQEYRASMAVEALRRRVSVTVQVIRDGVQVAVAAEQVVPGDIIELSAGALVPADARVLEARDCFVNQAVLTGESLPVEKRPGRCTADAGLAMRDNCVFMGTSVRSGWARVVAVQTGASSVFGAIASRLQQHVPETEFERGLRRFGAFLIRLMLFVVVVVLSTNIALHRPALDTLLFAAALAVGMSPELLPVILTVTLSHGARAMAREGVIVKRLSAIENLGSMDVLCTDKTGTLTRGVIQLNSAVDPQGVPDQRVRQLAVLNARLQTGIRNALDDALTNLPDEGKARADSTRKIDEIPYDFQRRRLSVLVPGQTADTACMITKGAVENVLAVCSHVQMAADIQRLDDALRATLMQRFVDWSAQGFRVLALAKRTLAGKPRYTRDDEQAMTLAGFLLFFDPPEPQVAATLGGLDQLGVAVKIITGDNRFVASHVAQNIGMQVRGMLTGGVLRQLSDEALWHRVQTTTLFAEIEPNQKERIINALQKAGHVVGYLGDGINDAPALKAADVGISVDTAVDVAKDAADLVLLRHGLEVIRRGIDEGRHTFANTIKYILINTSATFGNMISMALASMYLPFLPLLASQILLNNLLSDIPAMGIAGDRVDTEWERRPHRWDIRLIRRFMVTFGLVSSVFDLLTFAALMTLAAGETRIFRTGWFTESLLTELCILLVIRTAQPFYRSRPGTFLLWSTVGVMVVTLVLPFLPGAGLFGFVPLPREVLMAIVAITALYVVTSEATKRIFYRHLAGHIIGD